MSSVDQSLAFAPPQQQGGYAPVASNLGVQTYALPAEASAAPADINSLSTAAPAEQSSKPNNGALKLVLGLAGAVGLGGVIYYFTKKKPGGDTTTKAAEAAGETVKKLTDGMHPKFSDDAKANLHSLLKKATNDWGKGTGKFEQVFEEMKTHVEGAGGTISKQDFHDDLKALATAHKNGLVGNSLDKPVIDATKDAFHENVALLAEKYLPDVSSSKKDSLVGILEQEIAQRYAAETRKAAQSAVKTLGGSSAPTLHASNVEKARKQFLPVQDAMVYLAGDGATPSAIRGVAQPLTAPGGYMTVARDADIPTMQTGLASTYHALRGYQPDGVTRMTTVGHDVDEVRRLLNRGWGKN